MKMNLVSGKTAIIGSVIVVATVLVWKDHERRVDQEIDEFDCIMRELKANSGQHYGYYEKEACERKEVTKCCQIR